MPDEAKTPTTLEANKSLSEAVKKLRTFLRLQSFNSIDDLTSKVSSFDFSRPAEANINNGASGPSTSDVSSAVAPVSSTNGSPNNATVDKAVSDAKERAEKTKDDPNTNDSRNLPIQVYVTDFPESFKSNYSAVKDATPALHLMMNETGKSSNFSSRGSDIVAMFANLIPTIELSKCVPYLRINFVQNVPSTNNGQMPFLTLESFLGAARANKNDVSMPGYNAGVAGVNTPVPPPGTTVGNYQTGMELFLAPQTLINPNINQSSAYRANRGINVLDPMQPLMSLENVNIDVSAVSQNLMQTQQKIDLSIILHDRSRIAEISPLISPTVFPTVSVVIEWGWSHPDTNPFSQNVYARFLNGLRSKQVYSIYTSTLSNRDATSLSVKVQLISFGDHVTRAAAVTTGTAVDGTRYVPYDLVKAKLNQIVRISESNKTNSNDKKTTNIQVVGPDQVRIENPGWPTSDKWVKYDDFKAFSDAVSAAEKDVKKAFVAIDKYRAILTQVAQSDDSQPAPGNLSAALSSKISGEIAEMTYVQSAYLNKFSGVKKDYLLSIVKNYQEFVGNFSALGDLIFRLYTFPLSTAQIFDEIRVVTYDCNDNAGFMGGINIGCIPVPNADVIGLAEGSLIKPRTTVKSALQQLMKHVNTKTALAYGFRSTYTSAAELQKEVAEAEDDQDVEERAEAAKEVREKIQQQFDKQLADINEARQKIFPDIISETCFTPPRIKIEEIVVDLQGGGQGLHVYIYDEANSGYRHTNLVTSVLNSPSGKVALFSSSGIPATDRIKIERIADPKGKGRVLYNATIDRNTAKSIVTYTYPTIRIGSGGSVITNASYTSSTSGEIANINILNGYKSQVNPAADESGPPINADLFVIPVTVTLTMLGMPLINRGQVYYIDFGTGSTIDNVYVVTTVKHSIKAGSFTTTVSLNPLNSGSVRSVASALETEPIMAYMESKPTSTTSSGRRPPDVRSNFES